MENSKLDHLSIIRNYESTIETLTAQIEFYAHEQENLRKEIIGLISENKSLSKQLRELMESKSFRQSSDKQNLENKLVDNLKTQLTLTIQEKDTVVQLWQSSLRNIDHLEEELRAFSGDTRSFFSREQVRQLKTNYESQIKNLESQLEHLHGKIQNVLKTSSKTLEDKNFDLEKAFRDQKNTLAQMRALENQVKELQTKIKEIIEIRNRLEFNLKNKNKIIAELKDQIEQCKSKVSEAVQVVEVALREKDAALLRENKAKEEIEKNSKFLLEALEETSDKIKKDINTIQQECDSKLKQAHSNVDALKEELNNKNIELQKSIYEYKFLQNKYENVKKSTMCFDDNYTSKMLILDKNLETTFQKLVSSERNLVKMEAEKKRIRQEIQQLTVSYHNDIKKYQTENENLKIVLVSIKKKLKKYKKILARATEEETKLKLTIHNIESRDKFVESYLNEGMQMNKKWKKGMREVVHKYETQICNLRNANISLKRKLKRMLKEVMFRYSDKTNSPKKYGATTEKNATKRTEQTVA